MAKHFKILTLLLLTKSYLFGQVSYSSKVFHKHFQTCHFVGTTEEDFIIILNADSTINITSYTSSYRDQYNSVTKQVYSGTYVALKDTIKVKFITSNITIKSKLKQTNIFYPVKNIDTVATTDRVLQYLPKTYIISADKINSVDGLFPTLKNSTASSIMLFESKFMSWGKSAVYKKEIFGLTK